MAPARTIRALTGPPVPPVSVLARAVALLDVVERAGRAVALADLARATGLPRSTTHRLCRELVDLRMLAAADGGYVLGPRLHRPGRSTVDLFAARPHLEDLQRIVGGPAVQLCVLDGGDAVVVESLPATPARRPAVPVGTRLPARSCAAGKALLAFCAPSVVEQALAARPGAPTGLARELAGIRRGGIALERTDAAGVLGCAAPVLGPGERVVAAIAVSGLSASSLTAATPAVRMAAASVSRLLGALPRRGPGKA